MSERERLAFLSGAETMAEEIAKAVEQSEYQWAAHYAAFIRALPLLKPDEAALLRASAPPADVAELTERLESYDFQCEAGDLRHCIDWHKIKDALAALAGERDRLRALVDRGADLLTQWKNCDTQGWAAELVPEMDKLRLDMLLESPARAALGGSDA